MHGEFKTPGGKLVAVDLDVAGDRLVDVMVSGDFFLYPDEALSAITASLEGQPADLSETEYAARVRAALGPEVELLGSSPEAIAIAVRRALASESTQGAV